jgi:hypothetical protein
LLLVVCTPIPAAIEHCETLPDRFPAQFAADGHHAEALRNGRYQELLWALKDEGRHDSAAAVQRCLATIMIEGDIHHVEMLGGGISKTEKVSLPYNVSGVFKSTNSYDGCFRHELAAYVLDQRLQLRTVPMTVERTIGGKSGSLQYFVADAVPAHEAAGAARTPELKVLDLLIDNEDRHAANWLYYEFEGSRRLFGIDHNLSFGCRREAHLKVHDIKSQDAGRVAGIRQRLEGLGNDELEELLGDYVSRPRAIRKAGKMRDKIIWRLRQLEQKPPAKAATR